MPKFSVIIPIYNVENYLKKCVDSVLAQTFDDYEILLIDDGSKDGSGKVADACAHAQPQKIRVIHQENQGLGGARNTGIQNASGDYFFFLDSDDYIEPNMLEEISAEIEKSHAQMIIFDYRLVDEEDNELENVATCDEEPKVFTLKSNPKMIFAANSAANKICHKSLFQTANLLFPTREWYEDLSTVVKLYPFAEKISYLHKTYYNYLQRQGSIMKNANIDRNGEIISAIQSILDFYKAKNLYDTYANELEYLAVLHVYVLASVRVMKAAGKHPLHKEFKDYILNTFPKFHENPYVQNMSKKEKLIIRLIDKNQYAALKLLLRVNDALKK